jgi:hypothetical protein
MLLPAIVVPTMAVPLLHLFLLSKKARAVTQHTHNREKRWRGVEGKRGGSRGKEKEGREGRGQKWSGEEEQ